MAESSLPVRTAADFADRDVHRHGPVIGVVLAAGGSTRFGDENKLLTEIAGRPMIDRSLDAFVESDLDGVILVVGNDAGAVRNAVGDRPTQIIENTRWDEGQSTSVITGLEAASNKGAMAIIFGLGDMPWVRPSTTDRLIEAFQRSDAHAIAAAFRGVRGNPVLFTEATFDSLRDISGDQGGRDVLLQANEAFAIETGDPGVRRDVDRITDLPERS